MFSKFLMGGWVGEDRVIFFGYTELFFKDSFLDFFSGKTAN